MTWRDRVRETVLDVLAMHAKHGLSERIAIDVADSIPSPDERNGYVIVPKEPTNAQVIAALEFALQWMKQHNVDALSPFEDYPSPGETAKGMYRAMIAAAR